MRKVKGGFSTRGYKGKGGGSARQPVETADSLHSVSYARVLDLLGAGEIYGLVDGLRSVYLDGTPVENADGSRNFSGVTFDIRHGTQTQDYIQGFPAAESTISVGVALNFGTPWVRSISRPDLSAVRVTLGVNGLSKADTSTGDIGGVSVAYAIDLQTDGGAWVTVVDSAFTGKTTQSYRRTHRVDLPQGATGWTVRVRRLTPEASSSTTADATLIESIAEVIDAKLRYPMSAIAGVQVDASQFQSIPTRAYHIRGRIIRVPANYDPETAAYTGVWDGTFKTAYSNNPAWVFYDLVTNTRYGLGDNIPASWVNKWELYRIAQYCDGLVPDGRGGQERRFTCNLYLQSSADAYRVLQDLTGIFRGMVYWAAGSAEPVADMPRDPVYTYTQANVLDGKFVYTGTRRKDRSTVALVSYNDMTDMGRQKVVYTQDDEAVARYGIRKTEISAFGCTSEGQAMRLGKWALLTAKRETRGVTFSVGMDGTLVAPGSIIKVADNLLAGQRVGGRIRSATADTIVVDAPVVAKASDTLTVIMPNGVAETRSIVFAQGLKLTADTTQYTADTTLLTADATSLPGTLTEVRVSPPFSAAPLVESVWALESEALKTQLFTVMSVTEGDKNTFDISAIQHEPGKYAAIDYGVKLEDRPISVIPPRVQPAPESVTITSSELVRQGIASTTVTIAWTVPPEAVRYDVEWRRDDSDWIRSPSTQTASAVIDNAYTGNYVARVRAVNSLEVPSLWTQSAITPVSGVMAAPPAVVGLTTVSLVFGIRINWGFPEGVYAAQRTELWYSQVNDRETAIKLGDFSYPQNTHTMMGLSAGVQFFFWARLVDKNGLPGPWTTSVAGSSSSSANDIMDYLDGQITETQLSQELREKIESDDGASIEIAELKSELAAMYTMKVQLNANGAYHLAGIGIGVENNDGILQSQVLVMADRFAIMPAATSAATSAASPFIVQGGQVFMREAFIQDGTITNAKIGEFIQSTNFVSGVSGWRWDKNGNFENNGSSGSGRTLATNQNTRVFDSSGLMRVRWGIW